LNIVPFTDKPSTIFQGRTQHHHEWIIGYFLQFRCSSYLYCDPAITPHVEYANKAAVQRL